MFAPDTAQAGSEAVEGISKEKLNLNKKTTSGNFAQVYFGRCSSSSTLFLGSCFFFSSHAVSKQVSACGGVQQVHQDQHHCSSRRSQELSKQQVL